MDIKAKLISDGRLQFEQGPDESVRQQLLNDVFRADRKIKGVSPMENENA